MDVAGQELDRIMAASNGRFPSINWNLGHFSRRGEDGRNGMENKIHENVTEYYFLDTFGVNKGGDNALHRLMALHTPPPVLKVFLERRYLHERFEQRKQLEGSEEVCDEIHGFDEIRSLDRILYHKLPTPPRIHDVTDVGATALHVAVYRNSWYAAKVVKMLLEAEQTPDCEVSKKEGDLGLASIPMKCGSYPLHIMCGFNQTIQMDLFLTLLDAAPSVILMEDVNGDNALSMLWKNVLRFRWAISLEHGMTSIDFIGGDLSWMTVICPDQYLNYSLLLIKAARNSERCIELEDDVVTLQEVCAVPRCPPLLLRLILLGQSFETEWKVEGTVHTLDEDGMLPIHHAASALAVTHNHLPAYLKERKLYSVVELLLTAYPESAMVLDNKGRLPLHYALESGNVQEKALLSLLKAYPEALRVQDPVSGLYPFMLVAANSKQLLLSTPTMQYGSDPERDLETQSQTPTETHMEPEGETEPRMQKLQETTTATMSTKQQNWKNDENVNMSYLILKLCPEAVQYRGACLCN